MYQTNLDETSKLHITGTVKWFDPVKGYGFIRPDLGGSDVLIHQNVLKTWGGGSIRERCHIDMLAIKTERGYQALEVYSVKAPLFEGTDDNSALLLDMLPARTKWFCPNKDYGFANVFGESDDIYLPGAVLRKGGLASLNPGEAISLRIEQGNNGKIASHVLHWDTMVEYTELHAKSAGRA